MFTDIRSKIKQLQEISAALAQNKQVKARLQTVAMLQFEADLKERVFEKGLDKFGSKIGTYDTKPFYANPAKQKDLPEGRLKPLGKNGKSKFKNGKSKKTRYMESGYMEFRDRVDRQNNTVDLNLTGASLETIKIGKSRDNIVLGFTNTERMKILLGHEKKYGKKIFTPSDEEKENYVDAAFREASFVLGELLNTSA